MQMQTVWPRIQPFRKILYLPFRLLFVIGAILLLCISSSAALAHPAVVSTSGNGLQFTQQMRIGFHSGDDWEPSIAADRPGSDQPATAVARPDRCL